MALLVICNARTFEGMRFGDAQRQWGAAMILVVPVQDEPPEAIHRQLRGPFDVWSGEWWRIPVSAFHHADTVHLLLNCVAAWILGRRLERRWGSLRFAVFLLPAVLIPMLLELLAGNAAVGFSGAICAMLGALILLQRIDPSDDDLPDESIQFSLGFILLGIPISALDIFQIQIANVAHISGVVYGWMTAWALCGPRARYLVIRGTFFVAHLALIPAVWLVMHPINDGRYLWYLADRDHRIPPVERESLLKQAVQVDPSLTGLWLRLADHRLVEGNLPEAWNLLVEGLSHNPADGDLFEAARRVWRRLPHGPQRDAAESELQRVFGDQAAAWSRQIRTMGLASARPTTGQHQKSLNKPPDPQDFPLDRPIDLQWEPRKIPQESPLPTDPDRPDSAVEGKAL